MQILALFLLSLYSPSLVSVLVHAQALRGRSPVCSLSPILRPSRAELANTYLAFWKIKFMDLLKLTESSVSLPISYYLKFFH